MYTNDFEGKLVDIFKDFSREKSIDELNFMLKDTRLEGKLNGELPNKVKFHISYLYRELDGRCPIYHASIELGVASEKDKEIFRKFEVITHSYTIDSPLEREIKMFLIDKGYVDCCYAKYPFTAFMKIHIDDNLVMINPLQFNSVRKKGYKEREHHLYEINKLESDILLCSIPNIRITPKRTFIENRRGTKGDLYLIDAFRLLEKAKMERDTKKAEWYHKRIHEAMEKSKKGKGAIVDIKRLVTKDEIEEALSFRYWHEGHHGPREVFTKEDKEKILNKYTQMTISILLRKYGQNCHHLEELKRKKAHAGVFDYPQRYLLFLPLSIKIAKELNKPLYVATSDEVYNEWKENIEQPSSPFLRIYDHVGQLANTKPKSIKTNFIGRKIKVYPLFP